MYDEPGRPKREITSTFNNRTDLIATLAASSYIPLWCAVDRLNSGYIIHSSADNCFGAQWERERVIDRASSYIPLWCAAAPAAAATPCTLSSAALPHLACDHLCCSRRCMRPRLTPPSGCLLAAAPVPRPCNCGKLYDRLTLKPALPTLRSFSHFHNSPSNPQERPNDVHGLARPECHRRRHHSAPALPPPHQLLVIPRS